VAAVFVFVLPLTRRRLAAGRLFTAEGDDVTDRRGAVPAVQLPPNVFQNYGEAEDDDPYRYYESSYPAPRPVAPGDQAAYAQDDPAVRRRRARSSEGEEAGETQ